MARPKLEVADIFRQCGARYRRKQKAHLSRAARRVMRAIETCRTAVMGGHVNQCTQCGHRVISYNSCRNRHCPKCQSLAKAKWLEARQAELLPVTYFHVIFTIPQALASIALQNKRNVYNILFRAVSKTLLGIAGDPKRLGASIGFIAILHTWGQNLLHHPHLHCVVPGGGLSPDGCRWINSRKKFFLPVKVLSRRFRRLFLQYFDEAYKAGKLKFHGTLEHLNDPDAFETFLKPARKAEWVVYAKRPFGGPKQVLDYLGRYTHRVAISNHRLTALNGNKVTFRWRDYRHGNRSKEMTLDADEFIRRFLLHVLPGGFVRIRHYGLLANCHRREKLSICRRLLDVPEPGEQPIEDWKDLYEELTGNKLDKCPACEEGSMVCVEIFLPRSTAQIRPPPGVDSS